MNSINQFIEAKKKFNFTNKKSRIEIAEFLKWLESYNACQKILSFFENEIWPDVESQSNHGLVYSFDQIVDDFIFLGLEQAELLPLGSGCNGDLIATCMQTEFTGWLPLGQVQRNSAHNRKLFRAVSISIGDFFWRTEFDFKNVAKDWYSAADKLIAE
jgi:hypothetical protein